MNGIEYFDYKDSPPEIITAMFISHYFCQVLSSKNWGHWHCGRIVHLHETVIGNVGCLLHKYA